MFVLKFLFILLVAAYEVHTFYYTRAQIRMAAFPRQEESTPRHRKYLNRLSQRNLSISVIVRLAAGHEQVNFLLSNRTIIA